MPDKNFGNEAPQFGRRKSPFIQINGKASIKTSRQGDLGWIPNEEKHRKLIAAHPHNNIGMLFGVCVGYGKISSLWTMITAYSI